MDRQDASTTAGLPVDDTGGRLVWFRRIFIALLAVVVGLGIAGLLGVRSRTVDATSDDGATQLRVHYAQVARAGLDVPFRIAVTRQGGFDGDITIAVSGDYLDLFDRNAVDPEPSDSTATADVVIWHFTAPPGDTLQVSVDMQVQGGRHWGRDGSVAVLDDAGNPEVKVTFKTWLVP